MRGYGDRGRREPLTVAENGGKAHPGRLLKRAGSDRSPGASPVRGI